MFVSFFLLGFFKGCLVLSDGGGRLEDHIQRNQRRQSFEAYEFSLAIGYMVLFYVLMKSFFIFNNPKEQYFP